MRKLFGIFIVLLFLAIILVGYNLLGPTIHSPKGNFLYIKTGTTYTQLKDLLSREEITNGTFFFNKLARQVELDKNIKPGKYEIADDMSLIHFIRMLKNGKQSPVHLVITKLRTKKDLADKIARNFEPDSASVYHFLTNNDSLKQFGVDTNTVMTLIIPNTYNLHWNSNIDEIMDRMQTEQQKFWTVERIQKASDKALTKVQVYTLASIVEEETNKQKDRLLIASTYMNRLQKGMRLEADPTIKYAMRNFGLKRIYKKYLDYPSPYNTYRNTGLPPGPICTPGINTLDAVLDAPQTDYLFFAAAPTFNGFHNFAATYSEHLVNAKAYQRALDSVMILKAKKDSLQKL